MMPTINPPDLRAFTLRYEELVRNVEARMNHLRRRHAALLRCSPGCANCCQPLSLLAIEAFLVHQALLALPGNQQEQIRCAAEQSASGCPFLLHSLCAIYQARPLICRTHGLPIAYIDEEREVVEVSACPLNFPAEHPLRQDDLLFLDPFNTQLALLNQEFAALAGLPSTVRLAMHDLIREGFPPD